MSDYRVWAFSISPARTAGLIQSPDGGQIAPTSQLRSALDGAAGRVGRADWTQIAFRVEQIVDERGSRRSSAVRDLLLTVAFDSSPPGDDAALAVAARLSRSMDDRSLACLLVIVARDLEGSAGEVTLWAFPRDDAFRFQTVTRPTIELLEDVFSRTSRLRKAARFSGQRLDQSFLRGEALGCDNLNWPHFRGE